MSMDQQNEWLKSLLACPQCKGPFAVGHQRFSCVACGLDFGHPEAGNLDLVPPGKGEIEAANTSITAATQFSAKGEFAMELLSAKVSGRTLHLGALSADMPKLFPVGAELVVLNVDAGDLARASEMAREVSSSVVFVRGLAEYLPFGGATFDTVLTSCGLEQFQDVQRVFREVYRVLRPGGRFIALAKGIKEMPAGDPGPKPCTVTALKVAACREGLFVLRQRLWRDDHFVLVLERASSPTAELTEWAQGENASSSEAPRAALSRSPRVSVVIPCYNQGRFLTDAIESVQTQTHSEMEIVVVDDGSTDDTALIASRYPGVRFFRQENKGLAAARNAGLGLCTGAYVIFLDADDRLLPQAVRTGLEAFRVHPDSGFVYGHCTLISSEGIPLFTPHQTGVKADWYVQFLQQCFVWTPGTVMFCREALRALGDFDPSVNPTADYEMYLRTSRNFPVHCHEQVVLEYRQHGANMSGNSDLMLEGVLPVLSRQWPFVQGDARCEEAWRTGLRNYRLFYSDLFVREARSRSGERIRQIDAALAGEQEPTRRAALIDDWRQLYGWTNAAFQIRCAIAPEPTSATLAQPEVSNIAIEPNESAEAQTSPELLEQEKTELLAQLQGQARQVEELGRKLWQTERLESAARSENEELSSLVERLLGTDPPSDAWGQLKTKLGDVRSRWTAIRELWGAVDRSIPPQASLLVVSKGDDQFLRVGDRRAAHFPQQADGRYAGYHPNDSAEAIEQLEAARGSGAEYLVFPSSSFWWLEYYKEFAQHLACNYQVVGSGTQLCLIFHLKQA